jgi:hypothetical protein
VEIPPASEAAVAVKRYHGNGIETSLINTLFQGAGSKVLFFITEIQMLSKHHRLRWSLHVPSVNGAFRPIQYAK